MDSKIGDRRAVFVQTCAGGHSIEHHGDCKFRIFLYFHISHGPLYSHRLLAVHDRTEPARGAQNSTSRPLHTRDDKAVNAFDKLQICSNKDRDR